jgi:hypothetical protein
MTPVNARPLRRAGARAVFAMLALFATPPAAQALEFRAYARGEFANLVKAHAGRPFVAHYWSIACPACVAELPQWAKLIGERRDLDVLLINTDDEEMRERAAMRLEKAGLGGAANYGFADSFVEKLYFEVDRSWRGELPFTALVAADGTRTTVTGAIDDPDFIAWLKKTGRKP